MRDLTEEELKLAPGWANRYFIKGVNEIYFISSSHFRAVLMGCNNKPFSISQDCIELLNSKPIPIKKPFDITKHEFSDRDIAKATLANDYLCIHLDGKAPYVAHSKKDAIAIAKALGVTGEDLK